METPPNERPAPSVAPTPPPAMLPPGVSASTVNAPLPTGWKGFWYDVARTPLDYFADFRYKLGHLPQVNFELAQRMMALGRLKDAILRFRITLWLAPNHQMSWYYLGTCYLAAGNKTKALAAFAKSYQINTNHEETNFMIGTINPAVLPVSKKPPIMPRSIATEYFDRMAPVYDATQLSAGYRGHVLAEDAFRDFVDPKRINHHLLDLGCGTGLVGTLLSRLTERTVGVDISRSMLELAQTRRRDDDSRVYTETYLEDMRFFLADTKDQFELVAAIHVFNYMGDVSSVLEHIGKVLVEGGLFVFQTEPYTGGDFGLIPDTGRYGHSEAYIEGLLTKGGLRILRKEQVNVYPNYPLWQWVVTLAS